MEVNVLILSQPFYLEPYSYHLQQANDTKKYAQKPFNKIHYTRHILVFYLKLLEGLSKNGEQRHHTYSQVGGKFKACWQKVPNIGPLQENVSFGSLYTEDGKGTHSLQISQSKGRKIYK